MIFISLVILISVAYDEQQHAIAAPLLLHPDGITSYAGVNQRLEKLSGGYFLTWVSYDPKAGDFSLNINMFNQQLTKSVLVNGPLTICKGRYPIITLSTCSPPLQSSTQGVHIFSQLGDVWQQQTVVVKEMYVNGSPRFDVTVKGGYCGYRDPWNSTIDNPLTEGKLVSFDCTARDLQNVAVVWTSPHSETVGWFAYKSALEPSDPDSQFPRAVSEPFTILRMERITSPQVNDCRPKISFTGEGSYVMVWEVSSNRRINGIIQYIDETEEKIPGTPFEITEGMSTSNYDSPQVVPDRFGGGFIVLWRERRADATIAWMREFDKSGKPAADNPDPHVVWHSDVSSSGIKPVGVTTYSGQIWVSILTENMRFTALLDYDGTINAMSTDRHSLNPGLIESIELNLVSFGALNMGVAYTTATDFETETVVTRIDYAREHGSIPGVTAHLKNLEDFNNDEAAYVAYKNALWDYSQLGNWVGDFEHQYNQDWYSAQAYFVAKDFYF